MQTINKTPQAERNNFAPSRGTYQPGKTLAAIFHPKGTPLVTYAQRTDIVSAINAVLVAQTYASRGFFVRKFDGTAENNGEGVAYESRGQKKKQSDKGTWDMVYTLENEYADYIQIKGLAKSLGKNHRCVLVDENNVMRHSKRTDGEIYGFSIDEITVYPLVEPVVGAAVKYQIRIALSNIDEVTDFDHTVITDDNGEMVNAFDTTILTGVEQGVLHYKGSTGNGVHSFYVEASNGEENLVALYPGTGELKQVGAFPVTKAVGGAAVTTTSVAVLSENNEQTLIELTLDQTSYTNGDVAYINGAAIAAMFGYINRYIEFNPLRITLVK